MCGAAQAHRVPVAVVDFESLGVTRRLFPCIGGLQAARPSSSCQVVSWRPAQQRVARAVLPQENAARRIMQTFRAALGSAKMMAQFQTCLARGVRMAPEGLGQPGRELLDQRIIGRNEGLGRAGIALPCAAADQLAVHP
jgi:hypothetical protein